MPESTLAIQLSDLQSEVGQYLGYGRSYSSMSSAQQAQVASVINSGLRQFYYPQGLPNSPTPHRWSFLTPTYTFATVANQQNYDLPDDFGGFMGELTYSQADNVYFTVPIVGEGKVRQMQQTSQLLLTKPMMAALIPKKCDGAMGQRFQLTFWPTPDAVYHLTFAYNVLASNLTTQNPYPYGGAVHAEAIIQSCLAVAEKRLDNMEGPQWAGWLERLAASVEVDARNFRPETMGYNCDRSDNKGQWPPDRHIWDNVVSYNGQTYQ